MMLKSFNFLIGYLDKCLIWTSVSSSSLPICKLVCLFVIDLCESFTYSGYETLIRYMVCKYSLPVCRLSFTLLIVSFDTILEFPREENKYHIYGKHNIILTYIQKGCSIFVVIVLNLTILFSYS